MFLTANATKFFENAEHTALILTVRVVDEGNRKVRFERVAVDRML
jgi:hypothetical protein